MSNTAPTGSSAVESFLKEIETKLIDRVYEFYGKGYKRPINMKDEEIKSMRKNVGKSSMVVIPTDKTNSFRTIELEEYIKWVKGHLEKLANISSRDKIVKIYKKAKEMLDDVNEFLCENK